MFKGDAVFKTSYLSEIDQKHNHVIKKSDLLRYNIQLLSLSVIFDCLFLVLFRLQ